jgi:enterochelin esterase-like enzyme
VPGEASRPGAGPEVSESAVVFRLADQGGAYAAVRLRPDLHLPVDLEFKATAEGWELRVDRPPVARLEYLVELVYADGHRETVPDPANPRRAGGDGRSVVEVPGDRPPVWLAEPAPAGTRRELDVPAPSLGTPIRAVLWSPEGVTDDVPLPLLVAHDGPEYDRQARLVHFLAAGAAAGRFPPLRAALLDPGARDDWYSADTGYARELALATVPRLTTEVRTTTRVGMGTSLGALAMLHAHRRHPDAFDRLFLQSGSFFHPRYDAHEARFPRYGRIVDFVVTVLLDTAPERTVPTVMTCGAPEENVHNNRLLARALAGQGYDVTLHEVPDVHTFTAWRDAFDPHLTRLLADTSRAG